jgi:hypothetical protein
MDAKAMKVWEKVSKLSPEQEEEFRNIFKNNDHSKMGLVLKYFDQDEIPIVSAILLDEDIPSNPKPEFGIDELGSDKVIIDKGDGSSFSIKNVEYEQNGDLWGRKVTFNFYDCRCPQTPDNPIGGRCEYCGGVICKRHFRICQFPGENHTCCVFDSDELEEGIILCHYHQKGHWYLSNHESPFKRKPIKEIPEKKSLFEKLFKRFL